jgi:very-short-patch-repair endonuclease
MTKTKVSEFVCSKCKHKFQGLPSFQGEYAIRYSGVKNIRLCKMCLHETNALWDNEPKTIERHIREKIEYYTRQHGIDRFANAKRIASEEILELLTNQSVMFNGNNFRIGYGKDLNRFELKVRELVHDEFRINCEEQVQISIRGRRYVVDGLIELKGKCVVLEYDSDYYHSTEQQKQKDQDKDFTLTEFGGYTVLRISEDIIKNEKSRFRSHILDAMYGIKQKKSKAPINIPSTAISK